MPKTPWRLEHRLSTALWSIALCAVLSSCVSTAAIEAARGQPTMFTSHHKKTSDLHPNPAYYGLLPLTIPADIIATPVILVILHNQDWAP